MLAKPEYFSPPNEVCCWRGAVEELLAGTSVLAGSPVKTGQGAVKTGQAPRWSCWPGQVLAGVPWRRAIWKMMAGVPRRSAIWKMMAGALWRRGWQGRRGEEPSGSNCGRKCQCGSIGKRLLARPLWKSKAASAE